MLGFCRRPAKPEEAVSFAVRGTLKDLTPVGGVLVESDLDLEGPFEEDSFEEEFLEEAARMEAAASLGFPSRSRLQALPDILEIQAVRVEGVPEAKSLSKLLR